MKCYAHDTVNAMHDFHQATVEKTQCLKDYGYRVVEVWECDIKRELEQNEDMKQYFDAFDQISRPLLCGRTNAAKAYHQCQQYEKVWNAIDLTKKWFWMTLILTNWSILPAYVPCATK